MPVDSDVREILMNSYRPSPMRGRYLVRNRLANSWLRMTDAMLELLYGSPRAGAPSIPADPKRILIAVGGHLGDAVMATAMLADLHAAFPRAELGVVGPSWSAPVFDGHPLVRRTHVVDHWKLNRAAVSRRAKIARYRATARTAVSEIAAAGYDVAIDSYPFFPNMSGVLRRSGVPSRIGYASGGSSPLYTVAVEWADDREHVVEKQRKLTRLLARDRPLAAAPAYVLPPISPEVERRLRHVLGSGDARPIVLLHAGSGSKQKDWPIPLWVRLAADLSRDRATRVLLTGAGANDASIAREIARAVPQCASLVDALLWREFVGLVRHAALVVSADTSAAHVAAACGTRHVTLFTGINAVAEFRPLSTRNAVLLHDVPCAPCFRRDGCATMACVRGIAPDEVLRTSLALLNEP